MYVALHILTFLMPYVTMCEKLQRQVVILCCSEVILKSDGHDFSIFIYQRRA